MGDDPHSHVDVDLHADVSVRNMMSATFGLAGDLDIARRFADPQG